MPKPLVIATRKSPLALAQTNTVAAALKKCGVHCAVKTFSTTGDEITDRPLAEIGGKELFINTLRRALREGAAAIAVHSAKDMPAKQNPEFVNVAVGFAEDPRDVFISQKYGFLQEMPEGATIGTCSPRRAALLAEYFPHLKTVQMRGNIGTRLQKLKENTCDGIILAAAGLRRLNLIGRDADFSDSEVSGVSEISEIKINFNFEYLNPEIFIPAPGQGILAAECFAKNLDAADGRLAEKIYSVLPDDGAKIRLRAESAFAEIMGGDCKTPLGAHAVICRDYISLRAFYAGGGRFCKTLIRRPNSGGSAALAAAKIAAAEVLK